MEIKSAEFVISCSDYRKCPKEAFPEYAFIGRSNVGKSSLINMLTNHKGLAKTSSQPGKTQLINHFIINKNWFLVDLPGYGYARSSRESRKKWAKMIEEYILKRENLINTFVLLDSRLSPQQIDLDFIEFLGENGVPFALVFTKCDKCKQNELAKNVSQFKNKLKETWEELPLIFLTSSEKKQGKETLLEYVEMVNKMYVKKA